MIRSEASSAFLYRCLQLFSQGICILAAPFLLHSADLGYYFTMLSLASTQSLFELGFGQIVLSLYAKFAESPQDHKSKCNINLSLLHVTIRYCYLIASSSFFVICGSIGFLLLSSVKTSGSTWQWQWVALVSIVSCNFSLNRILTLIESSGLVILAYRIRSIQVISGAFIFAMISLIHPGLWIVCAFPLGAYASGSVILIYLRKNRLIPYPQKGGKRFSVVEMISFYIKNILHFQYKYFLSSLCGLLSIQLFLPLIFGMYGPIVAGRIGLFISITNGVTLLASSYATGNAQRYSVLISRDLHIDTFLILKKSIKFSILISSSFLLPLILFAWCREYAPIALISNFSFVSPEEALLLSIACVCNTLIYCCAVYLRAFLKEPLLIPSLLVVVLMYSMIFMTGSCNITLTLAAYPISAFFLLCISLQITFYSKRFLFHV